MKFSVKYHTQWGESLRIKFISKIVPMQYSDGDIWRTSVDLPDFPVRLLYHYEVVRDGRIIRKEEAWHSIEKISESQDTRDMERADNWLENPRAKEAFRASGVVVPVFSLRSTQDFGIGEFEDLKLLADWAAECGMKIIQLLPVNDTTATRTFRDSSPYKPISNFALNPIYLNLEKCGVVADANFKRRQKELNQNLQIDYVKTLSLKKEFLRQCYKDNGSKTLKSKSYCEFFDKTREWLLPYAVYCCLRDEYGTADYRVWGKWKSYSDKKLNEYVSEHWEEVGYYCFLQYHLDAQFTEAIEYVHSKGIMLKGDIPIGVNRCSVDCWQFPQLFNLDSQAGAPPDAFSKDGQNWYMPTYNWEEMEKDGYAWWVSRLKNMSRFFDAYRLDHVLGFFRIWEIPLPCRSAMYGHFNPALPYSGEELRSWGYDPEDQTLFLEDPRRKGFYHPRIDAPLEGNYKGLYLDFFHHRHNGYWKQEALKKLPALISATSMIPCAEDLGYLASCVPQVLGELDILSLELQLLSKNPSEHFGNVSHYPYLSVCATTTHDMRPLRAWWISDRDSVQDYYNNVLEAVGDAPEDTEPWIFREILRTNLKSTSMLAIFPIQDYIAINEDLCFKDPLAEQINMPSDHEHYWRYRLHINLEQLTRAIRLNGDLASLIERYR